MSTYLAGSSVTVTATFEDQSTNLPVDPTLVILKVSVAGAAATIYSGVGAVIFKESTGTYTADLDTTGKVGRWEYEWMGDPAGTVSPVVQAIAAGWFDVIAAPL